MREYYPVVRNLYYDLGLNLLEGSMRVEFRLIPYLPIFVRMLLLIKEIKNLPGKILGGTSFISSLNYDFNRQLSLGSAARVEIYTRRPTVRARHHPIAGDG